MQPSSSPERTTIPVIPTASLHIFPSSRPERSIAERVFRARRTPANSRPTQPRAPFSHKTPAHSSWPKQKNCRIPPHQIPSNSPCQAPPRPKKATNSHPTNHIPQKNSWHSSFPPTRIIKSVSKTTKTRPTRRVFAFNASHALSACLTDIFLILYAICPGGHKGTSPVKTQGGDGRICVGNQQQQAGQAQRTGGTRVTVICNCATSASARAGSPLPSGSRLTLPMPSSPSVRAAARDRSTIRPSRTGPRSFTRT